jgi:hypothetical protein
MLPKKEKQTLKKANKMKFKRTRAHNNKPFIMSSIYFPERQIENLYCLPQIQKTQLVI